LVIGEIPFERSSWGKFIAIAYDPLPFSDAFLRLPQGLQAVIRRCLERDLRRRYQSVADLAVALGEFGSDAAFVDSVLHPIR
jgi:serine/threonine-protein kinase